MKLNSNTVQFEENDRKALEEIVTKIASSNGIEDVESVSISMDAASGIISFKTACGDMKMSDDDFAAEEDDNKVKNTKDDIRK